MSRKKIVLHIDFTARTITLNRQFRWFLENYEHGNTCEEIRFKKYSIPVLQPKQMKENNSKIVICRFVEAQAN